MSASGRDRGPRVAMIAADLSTGGGVNRVIRDVAGLLAGNGCRVEVFSARSDTPPTYRFADGNIQSIQRRGGIAAYVCAIWAVRRSKPDFVISSWTQDNILVALLFLGSRTRVILTEHIAWHFHRPLVRGLRRLAYPTVWRVIVLNRRELAYYQRFLGTARLLANPVTTFAAAASAKHKRVVAIGHLTPRKNFGDALRAFAVSGIAADGWSLDIVGAGVQQAELEALIASLGLTSAHIHPPTENIGAFYSEAAIVLVTSTTEVFSLVLAEAMAARAVPLAFATDGPSFILEAFPELLVPIGDVAMLGARLAELARMDLAPLVNRVSETIERRFAPDAIAAEWRELLE